MFNPADSWRNQFENMYGYAGRGVSREPQSTLNPNWLLAMLQQIQAVQQQRSAASPMQASPILQPPPGQLAQPALTGMMFGAARQPTGGGGFGGFGGALGFGGGGSGRQGSIGLRI